jgi:glycosyltransferase involved in cell wall biosynthesis
MIGKGVLVAGNYDSILSVLGNSHYHISAFEFFESYGGPCILHDSRLTHIYHWRLGQSRFLELASRLANRNCTPSELPEWFQDRDLPSLFIESVAERAQPLIVHTKAYQTVLRERFGVAAELTTFPPNMHFADAELSAQSRLEARQRLGLEDNDFVVSTFGFLTATKAVFTCVVALEMLRSWGVSASLHFVGDPADMGGAVRDIAARYGIEKHVHLGTSFMDESEYRDYMLASDAAVQLRNYCFGQPSAALADCISAGLPTVASDDLASACEAPEYVHHVPDQTSPLLVAEALAEIWEHPRDRERNFDSRQSYLDVHNFTYYARRLREILGFV